jgi:hypothetical protein
MMNIIWSWMLDLINQHELLELEERQKFLVYEHHLVMDAGFDKST